MYISNFHENSVLGRNYFVGDGTTWIWASSYYPVGPITSFCVEHYFFFFVKLEYLDFGEYLKGVTCVRFTFMKEDRWLPQNNLK
jgi:hypothetical protein